jgi:NAD(P)H-dependent flavin oxidoreductase YrpB (nitropropane dioxygenase family)
MCKDLGMIHTPVCDVLGIQHPVALGGMPLVYNTTALAAAVSEVGGLGIIGCTHLHPDEIAEAAAAVRERTDKPFGLNFLLFLDDEAGFTAALEAGPAVMSFSWPRKDQDLEGWVESAHTAGCTVTFMAADVEDAFRGAEAGVDVIVAQGTEGGGHVGWMALSVLLPMVLDAVSPVPVIAAGGVADGRGLAAALAYGADGVLLGTRFLASEESGLHPDHKRAIVDSDGHDTVLTDIPDLVSGMVWPGAMSRVQRNRFIDRWAGREWALRKNATQVRATVGKARESGDTDEAPLFYGQDAGLIEDLPPAADIVTRIVTEAADIIANKLPKPTAD